MTVRMKITGIGSIRLALAELPKATAPNVVRRALIAAAKPILEAAAANAPVDEGELKRAMVASSQIVPSQRRYTKKASRELVRAFAGPNYSRTTKGKGYAPHAHLVEFGTGPRFHKNGKYVGQAPAQPFMRPAFDTGKSEYINRVQHDLLEQIDKAVKRQARKNARAASKRAK